MSIVEIASLLFKLNCISNITIILGLIFLKNNRSNSSCRILLKSSVFGHFFSSVELVPSCVFIFFNLCSDLSSHSSHFVSSRIGNGINLSRIFSNFFELFLSKLSSSLFA